MYGFGGLRKLFEKWRKPARDKLSDVGSIKTKDLPSGGKQYDFGEIKLECMDLHPNKGFSSTEDLEQKPTPNMLDDMEAEKMVTKSYEPSDEEKRMRSIRDSAKTANINFKSMKRLDLSTINFVQFPENQYMREVFDKRQIVLHHTVSPVGVSGDLSWWLQTSDRVATALIIHDNGTPYQCFSSKYWAHHLGIKYHIFKKYGFDDYRTRNSYLNKGSIGIEIDSLGPLVEHDGTWYWAKWDAEDKKHIANLRVPVPIDQVQIYSNGFRGFEGYAKYSDAQIKTTAESLLLWTDRYKIPLDYREDMWDMSRAALNGDQGVFTHNAYRPDKSDIHPQPEMIKMLQQVKRYV